MVPPIPGAEEARIRIPLPTSPSSPRAGPLPTGQGLLLHRALSWASETPTPDLGPVPHPPGPRPPPRATAGSHARPVASLVMPAHNPAPAAPAPRLGMTHRAGGRPEHTHLSRLDAGGRQDGPGHRGWGQPGTRPQRGPQEGPRKGVTLGGWPENGSPCRAGAWSPRPPRGPGSGAGKGLGAGTGPAPSLSHQPRGQRVGRQGRVLRPPNPGWTAALPR